MPAYHDINNKMMCLTKFYFLTGISLPNKDIPYNALHRDVMCP